MGLTEQLAAFVAGYDEIALGADGAAALRLHLFDTIGAAFAGSSVAETADVRTLVARAGEGNGKIPALGTGVRASLPLAVMLGTVAARCSEVDDIHLAACITPGAVIVPAAFAAAAATPGTTVGALLDACATGYEVAIRFGLAIDGPHVLYRGIWPTYVSAGFGVAAAVGRLLGLDRDGLADALGIAASLAVGTTGRPPGRTSRWFTMGCAAHNGVLAVLAAQSGMHGDATLLEGKWSAMTGIALEPEALIAGLGRRFELAQLSFKPWCAAKQTIAATEAFQRLLDGGFAPERAREILVEVPAAYAEMIDRGRLPSGRQESFASVQYQLALAAFDPQRAYDVERATVSNDPAVARLIERTRVGTDPALDAVYPRAWPARVTAVAADGSRYVRDVVHPLGDPGTAFGWPQAAEKFARVTRFGRGEVGSLADAIRQADRRELARDLAAHLPHAGFATR